MHDKQNIQAVWCIQTNTYINKPPPPGQSVAQMIGCDVIIENLFSEKDSSDYDRSKAFLTALH